MVRLLNNTNCHLIKGINMGCRTYFVLMHFVLYLPVNYHDMDNKSIKTFGEYIRSLRESMGCPQRKIAAELDIDPSLLGKFERNERHPNRAQIKRLAQIFKHDEEKLLEQFLSDHIANKVMEESGNVKILKVAEEKIIYLKKRKNA